MSPQLAVRVVDQLASALAAAHAHGLVHRDIKPSNALITGTPGREFAYLIDFGIAHDSSATKLTRTEMVLGTLAYMAPERFTTGKADARSDIYALACLLHECLTGDQPFPGDSMEQQFAGHLSLNPPRPSVQRPGTPVGFDEVIARGMAKNPDERYQSPHDLATAAEQALTTPAPTPTLHPAPTVADPNQTRRPPDQPLRPQQPTDLAAAPTQLGARGQPAPDAPTQFVAQNPPAAPPPKPAIAAPACFGYCDGRYRPYGWHCRICVPVPVAFTIGMLLLLIGAVLAIVGMVSRGGADRH